MSTNISLLRGKTLLSVTGLEKDSECVRFIADDGEVFWMYHDQDCCESVSIESVDGVPSDLLNSPILMAECVTQEGDNFGHDSSTWTFYKFATIHGFVTIRWFGSSNGYYSESVDFDLEKSMPEWRLSRIKEKLT